MHKQLDLGRVQHQVTTLNVLHLFKDERNQGDYEFVDELLLMVHLWNRVLHKEAYFLKDQVIVVVKQTELELGLRRSLQKLDYYLMRYDSQLELVSGIDEVEIIWISLTSERNLRLELVIVFFI